MNEIQPVDTTLRGGQQGLWALGTKTATMLSVAEQLGRAGFESLVFFVSGMIKKDGRSIRKTRGSG